jgi:hypothetical protein
MKITRYDFPVAGKHKPLALYRIPNKVKGKRPLSPKALSRIAETRANFTLLKCGCVSEYDTPMIDLSTLTVYVTCPGHGTQEILRSATLQEALGLPPRIPDNQLPLEPPF